MKSRAQDTFCIIRKALDLQIENLRATFTRFNGSREKIQNNRWILSVFFIGMMAVWQATQDKKYLEVAQEWATANR